MENERPPISGLWLPLVTPFKQGRLDEASLIRLLRHYLGQRVDGFILAATTGEGLTLDEAETERLVGLAAEEVAGRRPLYLGLSGSDTAKLVKAARANPILARRWLSHRLPLLRQAVAGRALSPFHRSGRGDRPADPDLQHPLSHRRQSGQ